MINKEGRKGISRRAFLKGVFFLPLFIELSKPKLGNLSTEAGLRCPENARFFDPNTGKVLYDLVNGKIYLGNSRDEREVLLTFDNGVFHRGNGKMGETLFTIRDRSLFAGEPEVQGPELYHLEGKNKIKYGDELLFTIHGNRLVASDGEEVLKTYTNMNLNCDAFKLILPILADHRW